MQESTEALKELLDLGIITQDEYDAKVAQMSPLEQNAEENEEEKLEVFSVNYDELKKLEELKKEGILSQEEYSKKAAQLVGIVYQNKTNDSDGSKTAGNWIKSNLLAIISIIALVCVLAFAGYRIPELQKENDNLQSQVDAKQASYSSLEKSYNKARKYQNVVEYFYLDHAVMYVEGTGNYYHRYGCPTLPTEYTYWLYNVESAKDHGYSECPTCFDTDAEAFVEKNWW